MGSKAEDGRSIIRPVGIAILGAAVVGATGTALLVDGPGSRALADAAWAYGPSVWAACAFAIAITGGVRGGLRGVAEALVLTLLVTVGASVVSTLANIMYGLVSGIAFGFPSRDASHQATLVADPIRLALVIQTALLAAGALVVGTRVWVGVLDGGANLPRSSSGLSSPLSGGGEGPTLESNGED